MHRFNVGSLEPESLAWGRESRNRNTVLEGVELSWMLVGEIAGNYTMARRNLKTCGDMM
jgi:hypothetical protein